MNKEFNKRQIDEKQKKAYVKYAKEKFGTEVGEDSTKYGEFISSYFAWIPLPRQKEKAEELQNMTKKNKR